MSNCRLSTLLRIATIAFLAATLSGCGSSSGGAPPQAQEGQSVQSIPRTSDGHPDFTGMWAGPGFRHTGKPTDNATVRRYTEANMTARKPGGEALFNRPPAGNV